ncbi:hypothetical protein [Bradyrhizobium genosp. SA-3]|uniref:hypothetical protein n=1 Tax=Bradyrhizobium genosp. SA-3 TaxID=508868 RepID=UPI001FE11E4B|nr:hypothetical protein [Bradyrhizobium genosp. SA-3]
MSRESLWLVHDDVVTLREIDDVVRYSWALRRAAIGSYRMTGGERSMLQTIQQWEFKCPLSRLTEKSDIEVKAAEHADALVKADPLDGPAAYDDLLVALLQALHSQGLRRRRNGHALGTGAPRSRSPGRSGFWPVVHPARDSAQLHRRQRTRGLEHLCPTLQGGHRNVTRYIGTEGECRSNSGTYFTVETHLSHLGELQAGDAFRRSRRFSVPTTSACIAIT